MDRLANAIIDKLRKDGSIKTAELYSDTNTLPETPYVIVKPEEGIGINTRQYRIIAHHDKGQLDVLEDYVFTELDKLLSERITDKDGARYKLYRSGYTDVTAEPEDDTYFMEAVYFTPMPGR